jgi:predicted MFS family arabinose efflux permease
MAAAMAIMGDQAMYVILPTHHESLGISKIQVGILLSVNRWIRLLTNHIAERLVHRRHPTVLYVAVLLLGAMTTLSYASWPRLLERGGAFGLLLLARVLWGLSWSVIRQVGIMTAVDTTAEDSVASVIGFYNGLSRVGSIVGLVFGAFMFDHLGFQWCFLALAGMSLIGTIPGGLARRSIESHESTFRNLRDVGTQDHTAGLMLCGLVSGCVPGMLFSTLGYVLKQGLGSDVEIGSWTIGIATFTSMFLGTRYVLQFLAGRRLGALMDRMGHRRGTFVFFCLSTAILVAAILLISQIWAMLTLVMLFFFCSTCLLLVLTSEAGRCGSRVFARFVSASDMGVAFGPLLGWILLKGQDKPSILLAIGAGYLAIGIAASGYRLMKTPPAEKAAA